MTLLVGLVLLLVTQAADPTSIEDELRRARNEYAYGNYEAAVEQLRALLYPMKLSTDAQVIEARKYLALSYYLLDRPESMKEEFEKLLYLDPDYELDPFTVAPAVVDRFEAIRKELKPGLDTIRRRRSEEKLGSGQGLGILRVIETRLVERSDIATFMPFGVGQFQNDDLRWGLFFCVTEAVLLSVNVGSYLWGLKVRHYTAEQRGTVEALGAAQYASLALFGTVWALGVFQARLNFAPTLIEPPMVHDEPLEPSTTPGVSLRLQF
jgi:tetratricopeptide (TPR) repeat protein